jgi:ssDNA thymidine ADP-ribosyltransferase DarT-like protein
MAVGCAANSARSVDDILVPGTDHQPAAESETDYTMTDAVAPAAREYWIYHFTHIDNLASVQAAGCLSCDAVARRGQMSTEVGAKDIKESRRQRTIPIDPGGHVGDYVPFYFAPRSPMMYRIACDHRDGVPDRYQGGDTPLVYLVTTVGAVLEAGLTWVATDGNASQVGKLLADHALGQRIIVRPRWYYGYGRR